MTSSLRRAAALSIVVLTAVGLAACGSSSSSTSSSAASSAAPSEAPSEGASATGAVTYCEPLAAAYAIKPPSGSTVTDEELAAFADALEPAYDAANADGRTDIADLFLLLAQMNAAPDQMTAEMTNEAFTQLAALGPEVQSDCGIDLMQ